LSRWWSAKLFENKSCRLNLWVGISRCSEWDLWCLYIYWLELEYLLKLLIPVSCFNIPKHFLCCLRLACNSCNLIWMCCCTQRSLLQNKDWLSMLSSNDNIILLVLNMCYNSMDMKRMLFELSGCLILYNMNYLIK